MVNKSGKSFRLRQNASQSSVRKEPKNNHKKVVKAQPKKTEKEINNLVYPSGDTAFKAILSARFCAAIWSHITDCDETFNYWEPTHYLVFGKGLQTWEYSPVFALRSYTYLLLHAIPAYLYNKILQPNPLLIFYFIRCLLGLACSFAEVYFYKAVCKEFGVHVGRLCLAFQLLSAGMFISSTAFLPSTFAMYTFAAACAAWWQQKYPLAIFFTALGSLLGEFVYSTCPKEVLLLVSVSRHTHFILLVGWPFAALLGVPIAFDMLYYQKKYRDFVQWSIISAVTILGPMVAIDTKYYGKFTIAPLNIVKYNVLGGAGPELYGREPFSFYIINGFLNFNFIWVLALIAPLVLVMSHFLVPARNRSTLMLPHYLSLAPLYLWLAVFLYQPHKEERFLFPIYPMICLAGAISVDVIQKLIFRLLCLLSTKRIDFIKFSPSSHYLDSTMFVMFAAIGISGLFGLSRIFSLYKNYHAPLDLTMELNKFPLEGHISESSQINVCLGKDWYRFPGSFFLPNTNWNVCFIKSEFNGMLPAPYSESENGTQIIHTHFNDRNEGDPSVFVDINICHFLLDLNLGKESDLEPNYSKMTDKWKIIETMPFLDAEKSHPFFRAFYIPFVSSKFIKFGNFSLLQSVKSSKVY